MYLWKRLGPAGRITVLGLLLLGFGVQAGSRFGQRGLPAALTPSPAHAAALPHNPFIAFLGPPNVPRGLLTRERRQAEGIVEFSSWLGLRLAAMTRPLDALLIDAEAFRTMSPGDQEWLRARFREGVVIVALGVDQDALAPILGLSRLRDPREAVIPMGPLEYTLVYSQVLGEPEDRARLGAWLERLIQTGDAYTPGIRRPLFSSFGKAIGRLDSDLELQLLWRRVRSTIEGAYALRAQFQEAQQQFQQSEGEP